MRKEVGRWTDILAGFFHKPADKGDTAEKGFSYSKFAVSGCAACNGSGVQHRLSSGPSPCGCVINLGESR